MATIYKRELVKGTSYTLQWFEKGKRKRKALGFITEQQAKKRLHQHEIDLIDRETDLAFKRPVIDFEKSPSFEFEVYADKKLSIHCQFRLTRRV